MDGKSGKAAMEVTTTDIHSDSFLAQQEMQRPNRNLRNAIYTIICGVALPCIPVIVVSSVLLYITFKHRIIPQPGWPDLYITSPEQDNNVSSWIFEYRHQDGRAAYYVAYNPSTITTISAWTGRVIPYLSSSIMALVDFFAARHMVHKSKHGSTSSYLPTPEQLTILIGLLDGNGFGPLKDTLLYRYSQKKRLVSPVPAAFSALAIIILLGCVFL